MPKGKNIPYSGGRIRRFTLNNVTILWRTSRSFDLHAPGRGLHDEKLHNKELVTSRYFMCCGGTHRTITTPYHT